MGLTPITREQEKLARKKLIDPVKASNQGRLFWEVRLYPEPETAIFIADLELLPEPSPYERNPIEILFRLKVAKGGSTFYWSWQIVNPVLPDPPADLAEHRKKQLTTLKEQEYREILSWPYRTREEKIKKATAIVKLMGISEFNQKQFLKSFKENLDKK